MKSELNQLVDALPGLVWTAQPDGEVDFVNQRWREYTGLSLQNAAGWSWQAAIHPEDLPRVLYEWRVLLLTRKPGEVEARVRRFDGTFRWFLIRAVPSYDERGKVAKWYGQDIDIEDRKLAESLLTGEKHLLEMVARGAALPDVLAEMCRLVEAMTPDCSCSVLLVDVDGTRLVFGAAPSVPTGLTEAVMSLPLNSESGACATAVCQKQQVIAADIKSETRWRSSGWCSVALQYGMQACWSTPIWASDARVLGSFALLYREPKTPTPLHQTLIEQFTHIASIAVERARDEDAVRQSQEALGKLRSELTHMARVTTLGALTASIAHEVNQPLSGIITNGGTCLRMLANDPPNVDGARETARRTIRDAHRAADVLTRLRAIFGKKEPVTESVDLNEAIREVIALTEHELNRNQVVVRTELAGDLPPATGDRVQLQQVILNLLLNGSDAMRAVHDRPRRLVVSSRREDGDRVCLSVEDTGAGIEPEKVEQLFEAFYTTKAEGMGMGLAVSRAIIQSHHGRLWAAPNEGPGATFAFSIPCGAGQPTEDVGDAKVLAGRL